MNINRHNYEEFFLLYVDNELSAQERASVEQFVSQNADLKNELDFLQMSVMDTEQLVFENKDKLFRKEEGISISNYENYFLLAVDNELNEEEKISVEKFVLKHPALQNEFAILQKTKLPTEHIPYENKEELYRKERRILPLMWMRMSVAAAVIGVIVFSWLATSQMGKNEDGNIVATTSTQINGIPKVVAKLNKETKTISTSIQQPKDNVSLIKNEEQNQTVDSRKNKIRIIKTVENKLAKTEISKVIKEEVAKEEVAKNVIIEKETMSTIITENKRIEKLPIETISANEKAINVTVANTTIQSTQSTMVTQAVYTVVDTNTDDDQTVYIGSVQINKNKLKGLFKKASGIFGKKENKEPNGKSVQVAGFEIKTT